MNWDYLAGFIDGEGSIIIKPPRVRLYISNTDKEVLGKIQMFLKCGAVYEIKRKNRPRWSTQYGWTLGNHKEVFRILKHLEKHLIVTSSVRLKATAS